MRGIGYNEDVGDVGIFDHLPSPQTSVPPRCQPRAAEQHLDLRKQRLRLRRIELIRVGPALGSPRPLFRSHETVLLRFRPVTAGLACGLSINGDEKGSCPNWPATRSGVRAPPAPDASSS